MQAKIRLGINFGRLSVVGFVFAGAVWLNAEPKIDRVACRSSKTLSSWTLRTLTLTLLSARHWIY